MTKPVKSVLVTGAAKRLGRAIALDLGAHGWSVAVHYNNSQAEAEETVAMLHERHVHAVGINADLAMEDDTERLIARAREAVGPLGPRFRELAGDSVLAQLTPGDNNTIPPALADEWQRYFDAFVGHYQLDGAQTKAAQEKFDKSKSEFVVWMLQPRSCSPRRPNSTSSIMQW